MARCILMTGAAAGIDPGELTATDGDVVKGKIAGVAGSDEPMTGTLELTGNATAGDIIKGKTAYTTNPKSKVTGTLALTGNIAAADIRKGKTGYSTDPKTKITGTMAEQAAQTITPGTANKTIAANRFLTGVQTISGDKNLIGANIIRGKTIFGVAGEAVYAGDIKGYFLLPPNEYESLTGGWVSNRGELSAITVTRPSADIIHIKITSTMDDNGLGGNYSTRNKIVNKYRYIYLDYKNLNVKWSGKKIQIGIINFTSMGLGLNQKLT